MGISYSVILYRPISLMIETSIRAVEKVAYSSDLDSPKNIYSPKFICIFGGMIIKNNNKNINVKCDKKNKYNNVKCYYDGKKFDSKAEMEYYQQLLWLKKAGEIKSINCQVRFELQPAYKLPTGKTIRNITYVADFVVGYSDGKIKVIDVKGKKTDVYELKKKMLLYKYPDIDFEEVQAK